MKNKHIIVLLLLIVNTAFSQQDIKQQFRDLAANKQTYLDIVETYHDFINTIPESNEKTKFIKHFARWAYYQSYHLGPDGEFVNINKRTMRAIDNKPSAIQRSVYGEWEFVGPSDTENDNPNAWYNGLGRVDRIAFHPTNANIIYIGTPAGGLWENDRWRS